MKRILILVAACAALFGLSVAQAQMGPMEQLERAVLTSMFLKKTPEESRFAARILGQRYRNDVALCDLVAERLLQPPASLNGEAVDTLAWYVITLRDNCSQRYRDVLTEARARYPHEKITKHVDLALAVPMSESVEQYKAGSVNLVTFEADLNEYLASVDQAAKSPRGASIGTQFGRVLQTGGIPRDLTAITVRVARWGRATYLTAHYDGAGMFLFRKSADNEWTLADSLDEVYPVGKDFKGENFGLAQALVCLRGETFREFVKMNTRDIKNDRAALWAIAHRLSRTPFPTDRYEEDGMLVAVELIVRFGGDEAPAMLELIGNSPGTRIPETARAYARKLEIRKSRG
jgi:hypothetical protein